MFRVVPQKTFDQEHKLRLLAEARAEAAGILVVGLQEQNEKLLTALANKDALADKESERHILAQADLLDRLIPKPHAFQLIDGDQMKLTSAAEIRSVPAATRREMILRERAARVAEERDMPGNQNREPQKQPATPQAEPPADASLSPKESEKLDSIITGVY